MSKRTKEGAKAELRDLLAKLQNPAPDWRDLSDNADRFVDALQEHMEDEFLERARAEARHD